MNCNSKSLLLFSGVILFSFGSYAQDKQEIPSDSIRTDTTKVVIEEHPQEAAEAKFELKFKGYVKLNAFFDLNGMRSTEGFKPITIPIDSTLNERQSGAYIGARQSRIGFESRVVTPLGNLETYIEGDFAGDDSGLAFRMRHAYGKIAFWTVGHTWTTFMDLDAMPYTVDFEGPNSSLFKRQGLIRYERKFGNNWSVGASLENPSADFENPFDSLQIVRQSDMDIPYRVRFTKDWGHLQVAGINRIITYATTVSSRNTLTGYGISASGRVSFKKGNGLYFQYFYGSGISSYVNGLAGWKLDAVPNRNSREMELVTTFGGYVSYQYKVSDRWMTNIVVGNNGVENFDFQPENSFQSASYAAVNAFFDLLPNLELAGEFTVGQRVNKNQESGFAERLQFYAKFSF